MVCFLLKDNRENHTHALGPCDMQMSGLSGKLNIHGRKKSLPIIFFMYMRVWAQCPLCSSDAQTLFSGLAVLCPRLRTRLYTVMSPVCSGVLQLGCPVVVSFSAQKELCPLPPICVSLDAVYGLRTSAVFFLLIAPSLY